MNDNLFGCGCFLGSKKELLEICNKKGFEEVIEHFKL